MTEHELEGRFNPPLRPPLERFLREVVWPEPADDPDEEPAEPWAHRGHLWDER